MDFGKFRRFSGEIRIRDVKLAQKSDSSITRGFLSAFSKSSNISKPGKEDQSISVRKERSLLKHCLSSCLGNMLGPRFCSLCACLLVGYIVLATAKQHLVVEVTESVDCEKTPFRSQGSRSDDEALAELQGGDFNVSHPIVRAYASIADTYLAPWRKIDGIKSGYGSTGLIKMSALEKLGHLPQIMSCCGHVRIVNGKVYFRYGGFLHVWYRLRRFNQSIKMIKEAIEKYKLFNLNAEFFLSSCDHPGGFENSMSLAKAGFPLFGYEKIAGGVDIIVPDPLDLSESYFNNQGNTIPWEQKQAKAVFRGASTNFDLKDGNWGASPRWKLHRLSEVRPDLINAKVMRWSHVGVEDQAKMKAEGIELGSSMDMKEKSGYRYEIVVDGGVGSCRTCGVFGSDQVMFRQATPFVQFFEPLLVDGVHYVKVKHNFEDLPLKVEWANRNDKKMRAMVKRANEMAKWACTWEGRTLFWAVILAKYPSVLDNPSLVEEPKELCNASVNIPITVPKGAVPPRCGSADADKGILSECAYFCVNGKIENDRFKWLSADSLDSIDQLGPRQSNWE